MMKKDVATILGNLAYEIKHCDYKDPVVGRKVKKATQQICQLFEPKPKMVGTVLCPCVKGEYCPIHDKEPKPSKTGLPSIQLGNENSPLITDRGKFNKASNFVMGEPDKGRLQFYLQHMRANELSYLLDAVGDRGLEKLISYIASIKDAECQEMVERIFNLAEEYCPHNHKDGIQNRPQHYCEDCWQALKKKKLK